jgi:predicted amidohydrolase
MDTNMEKLRAASVQFEHAPGNKEANLDKIRDFCGIAAMQKMQLVVFPECCITGYTFLRGLTREQLVELAEGRGRAGGACRGRPPVQHLGAGPARW